MLVALHGDNITWQNMLKLKASVIRYIENLHPTMNLLSMCFFSLLKCVVKSLSYIYDALSPLLQDG